MIDFKRKQFPLFRTVFRYCADDQTASVPCRQHGLRKRVFSNVIAFAPYQGKVFVGFCNDDVDRAVRSPHFFVPTGIAAMIKLIAMHIIHRMAGQCVFRRIILSSDYLVIQHFITIRIFSAKHFTVTPISQFAVLNKHF